MFKKIISLMVAVLIVASCAVVAVSAAEVADKSVAAEVTDTAAAADDASEASGASTTINFEVPSTWKNFKQVYAHIWMCIDDGSVEWPAWKTRKEKMTDNGDGTWSYDTTNAGTIDPNKGAAYAVIFVTDTGVQTYNLVFGADCFGDTAYVTGNTFENPEDSNKTCTEALWKSGKYGPEKKILSTGNDVVGNTTPAGSSDAEIMANWMKAYYADATKTPNVSSLLTKMGVSGQEVYDKLVNLVEKDDKKNDILNASAKLLGVTVSDPANPSSAASNGGSSNGGSSNGGSSNGNSGNNASGNNASGNNASGNNNSGNNSSGNGSSSNGSNSVSSGQDSTIVFVLGGVMFAALAVLFVTRKREN